MASSRGRARRRRAQLPRRLPRDTAGRRPAAVPAGAGGRARRTARCACCSRARTRAARAWACCCAPALPGRPRRRPAPRRVRQRPAGATATRASCRVAFAGRVTLPRPRIGDDACRSCSGAPTCSARRRWAPRRPASGLLEAMATGTAVIASRLAGYDEVVRDERGGPAGAASRRPRPGRRPAPPAGRRGAAPTPAPHDALRRARRYDWERVTGEIEAVYDEVAAAAASAAPAPPPAARAVRRLPRAHVTTARTAPCRWPTSWSAPARWAWT